MELEFQSKCRKVLRDLGIKYIYHGKTHKSFKDNDFNLVGMPDIFILYQGKTIAIEFKSEKGLLNSNQLKWRDYLLENNFKYYLIREYNRFIEVLKENNFIKD